MHFYGSPQFNLNSCLIRALSEPLALMEKKKATDSCDVFVIALTPFHSVMTMIQFSIKIFFLYIIKLNCKSVKTQLTQVCV